MSVEGIVKEATSKKKKCAGRSPSTEDVQSISSVKRIWHSDEDNSLTVVETQEAGTSSHGPQGNEQMVDWERVKVFPRYVPILGQIRRKFPLTFESFDQPFPILRMTFYEMLGDTVLALDQREIQTFYVVEVNTLIKVFLGLNSSGLNMDWLRAHMERLIGLLNHHIDYKVEETLKKEITMLSLWLESM
ncbi:hypothetical protein F0562_032503 [Nyssa sinensis]|uniref:Uncharacterized protein n=1 Tax=Nyssa sinensis TaxID=561372 RepID=A0A5J5AP79_9ASTE|nr:hypothetical protein F0562_032503 [Nyssa sinensis]